MHRRILAAATALAAPVAALATAVPASATPVTLSATHQASSAPPTRLGTLRVMPRTSARCAGTPTMRVPGMFKGMKVAELDVYLLPKNGGTVVACMRHVGGTRGFRSLTSVDIAAAPTVNSKKSVIALGHGLDRYYSGPAVISGIKGNCFAAAGAIEIKKGTDVVVETKPVCVKK